MLRSECPPEQSERLLRLKQLSDPVSMGGRDGDSTSEAIVELIKAMDPVSYTHLTLPTRLMV